MDIHSHPVFKDIKIIDNFYSHDNRGYFVKIFNRKIYEELGINFSIRESYYSISHMNVIRGMHFQSPPNDHAKLVYMLKGRVMDVILDLRKNSPTYKEYITLTLTDKIQRSLYIPRGFAHGFKCLENNTIMVYNVSSEYNSSSDTGIKWDSIGLNWEVENPIISERDQSFINLTDFDTPFKCFP